MISDMIKYLIMDVDGSLTDGKIYMGSGGEVMKAFSIKDGYVFGSILKSANVIPVVITARTSKIVKNRCDELGIEEVHQGKIDKFATLKEVVGEENIGKCAYFGDDLIDLKCMNPIKEAGGLIGCPIDAVQEIRVIADYVSIHKAGEGALREFVEWLMQPKTDEIELRQRVEFALNYLQNLQTVEADAEEHVVNDDFFYFVKSYGEKAKEDFKLESHKKYIDIQIMVSGSGTLDIVDISRLTIKEDYDFDKDVMYWNIPDRMAHITLRAGDYTILYPENAHRSLRLIEEGTSSLKIVGKVRI